MTEPSKIKSEDSYTFYRLNDGRYADSLLEENIDMSWNSFSDNITVLKMKKLNIHSILIENNKIKGK
jgi:hypothetical protein